MAIVNSYSSFDIYGFNISQLNTYSYDANLYEDINFTYGGVVYQDIYEVDWFFNGTDYASAFGGTNLSASPTAVTGGTVTGYSEAFWTGSQWAEIWNITDLNVAAVDVYALALTTSTVDDMSFIRSTLSGNDKFFLSNQADNANGFAGNDFLKGYGGGDTIDGGGGNDTIGGGAGNDFLFGGPGKDFIKGSGGKDTIKGGEGDDFVRGGKGNDSINGGGGNDTLKGGQGSDAISGDGGNDTLKGAKGSDDFIFKNGFGSDTITDFDAADDNEDIDLSGVTQIENWLDLLNNHMKQVLDDVVITQDANSITLIGVDLSGLDQDDFIF